jgi:outer membrane protein OmpA-like peptidoglycan-associated protein
VSRWRRLPALLAAAALVGGCETVAGVAEGLRGVGLPGAGGAAVEAVRLTATAAPKISEAFAEIEEGQEIELGRAITAAVGRRYPLLRDPALTRYVALVGNTVAGHSDRPDLRYSFAVLDTEEVNAFAAPGGFVFVTRGTLRSLRDEAALAGVLGHEIAHIALYHGVKAIKAGKQKELALFAVREGVAHSRAAAFQGAIAGTADFFMEHVVLKGYSREQEAEADRLGQAYAARAGYHPAGLRDFLSVLVERGAGEAATFLSTHPGTRERRDELDQLLAREPGDGRRNPERLETALRSGPAALDTRGPAAARPPAPAAPGAVTALAPSPAPPAPSEVARALAAAGRYVSQQIVFAPASDRLRPEALGELREVAAALAADPALRLRIEGHTDAEGDPELNRRLSERRAQAVKATLVGRLGVRADRLSVVGVGAARPVAPNDTPDGRARNRRVEFVRE